MPLYTYKCTGCAAAETLVAGFDDHFVSCPKCGALMERQEPDPLIYYFDEAAPVSKEAWESLGNKKGRCDCD